MSTTLLLATLSVPRPTSIRASRNSLTGAIPCPSFRFDFGQCAMAVPDFLRSSTSWGSQSMAWIARVCGPQNSQTVQIGDGCHFVSSDGDIATLSRIQRTARSRRERSPLPRMTPPDGLRSGGSPCPHTHRPRGTEFAETEYGACGDTPTRQVGDSFPRIAFTLSINALRASGATSSDGPKTS